LFFEVVFLYSQSSKPIVFSVERNSNSLVSRIYRRTDAALKAKRDQEMKDEDETTSNEENIAGEDDHQL